MEGMETVTVAVRGEVEVFSLAVMVILMSPLFPDEGDSVIQSADEVAVQSMVAENATVTASPSALTDTVFGVTPRLVWVPSQAVVSSTANANRMAPTDCFGLITHMLERKK
jgi:hypothetical protein